MANRDEKWEDNVPGPFYVDKECILCSLCVDVAPSVFKESEDGDHDVVYHQPENEDERQAALDAMEQCPVNAIGDDGEG
ncbi:MAG TPA: ferredoxin [Planctomycetes bacterium]|nr:ferredoxin [Planctomycetota bacterium]